MYLGSTMEEKRDSVNELYRRSKKLGMVFGIFGIFYGLLLIYMGLSAEASIITKLTCIFSGIISPFLLYWGGCVLYFGFIAIKSWFVKRDISASDVASAAGTTLTIAYLLGGKKTAKTSAFLMFLIFGLVVTIGWWVGLYNYFALKKYTKVQPA